MLTRNARSLPASAAADDQLSLPSEGVAVPAPSSGLDTVVHETTALAAGPDLDIVSSDFGDPDDDDYLLEALKLANSKVFRVPDDVAELAKQGIEDTLAMLRLIASDVPQSEIGNRPLKKNSVKTYGKHYNGLRYFFATVGDYESLLMLQEHPPTVFCPSMNPETIANFIRFKRGDKESPLRDSYGAVVHDVFGNPMVCQGGWNDPRNVDQLLSAVTVVHAARRQRGEYEHPCDLCQEAADDNNFEGCRFHPGRPQVWRKGNPKRSDFLSNVLKQNAIDGAGYITRGDSPLTPYELLDIREDLLSSGKLWDLEKWVMTLVACKLFLREEEAAALQIATVDGVNAINWDITCITGTGDVNTIAFKIKGKCDVRPVTLTLWRDDKVPEMCPIRHILAYVHLVGIKRGYLFPSKRELDRLISSKDGNSKEKIAYQTYQTWYKETCYRLIKREGPFGSHSNRKTGYLLAVWGGASDGELFQSARHKSIQNAMKYKRDAAFHLHLSRANHIDPAASVSEWQPIYCADVQLGRTYNRTSSNKSILHHADSFVRRNLDIPSDHPLLTVKYVVTKATESLSKSTAKDLLLAALDELKLNDEGQKLIKQIFEAYAQEKCNEFRTDRNDQASDDEPLSDAGDQADGHNIEPDAIKPKSKKSKKRKRGGENDLVGRADIKSIANSKAKVKAMKIIYDEVPEDKAELTEGARWFVTRQLNPVVECLVNHHGGDHDAFAAKWPKWFPTTFAKNQCKGEGTSCGYGDNTMNEAPDSDMENDEPVGGPAANVQGDGDRA